MLGWKLWYTLMVAPSIIVGACMVQYMAVLQ